MTEERREVVKYADLVAGISQVTGVKRTQVDSVLLALSSAVVAAVMEGKIFRLRNLGNVRKIATEERQVRNPRTGETFTAPPGYRIKFSAGSAFKPEEGAAPAAAKPAGKSTPSKPAKPAPKKEAKPAPKKEAKAAPKKETKVAPTQDDMDELEALLEDEA